jgi:hypothetical protein
MAAAGRQRLTQSRKGRRKGAEDGRFSSCFPAFLIQPPAFQEEDDRIISRLLKNALFFENAVFGVRSGDETVLSAGWKAVRQVGCRVA